MQHSCLLFFKSYYLPEDTEVEAGVPALDAAFSEPFVPSLSNLAECRLISSFFSV